MAAPLHCCVITPERQVFDADASAVVFPAHDGLIGILHDRAPLLCELGIGVLRVDTTEGASKHFFVDGGFAQVLHNEVTILTDRAAAPEEINRSTAEKAMSDAQAIQATNPEAIEAKRRAIERARVQLSLAARPG